MHLFYMIKHSINQNNNYKHLHITCYVCQKNNHISIQCPEFHLIEGNLKKFYEKMRRQLEKKQKAFEASRKKKKIEELESFENEDSSLSMEDGVLDHDADQEQSESQSYSGSDNSGSDSDDSSETIFTEYAQKQEGETNQSPSPQREPSPKREPTPMTGHHISSSQLPDIAGQFKSQNRG